MAGLRSQGNEKFKFGDYESAHKLYAEAIREDERDIASYSNRSAALLALGMPGAAAATSLDGLIALLGGDLKPGCSATVLGAEEWMLVSKASFRGAIGLAQCGALQAARATEAIGDAAAQLSLGYVGKAGALPLATKCNACISRAEKAWSLLQSQRGTLVSKLLGAIRDTCSNPTDFAVASTPSNSSFDSGSQPTRSEVAAGSTAGIGFAQTASAGYVAPFDREGDRAGAVAGAGAGFRPGLAVSAEALADARVIALQLERAAARSSHDSAGSGGAKAAASSSSSSPRGLEYQAVSGALEFAVGLGWLAAGVGHAGRERLLAASGEQWADCELAWAAVAKTGIKGEGEGEGEGGRIGKIVAAVTRAGGAVKLAAGGTALQCKFDWMEVGGVPGVSMRSNMLAVSLALADCSLGNYAEAADRISAAAALGTDTGSAASDPDIDPDSVGSEEKEKEKDEDVDVDVDVCMSSGLSSIRHEFLRRAQTKAMAATAFKARRFEEAATRYAEIDAIHIKGDATAIGRVTAQLGAGVAVAVTLGGASASVGCNRSVALLSQGTAAGSEGAARVAFETAHRHPLSERAWHRLVNAGRACLEAEAGRDTESRKTMGQMLLMAADVIGCLDEYAVPAVTSAAAPGAASSRSSSSVSGSGSWLVEAVSGDRSRSAMSRDAKKGKAAAVGGGSTGGGSVVRVVSSDSEFSQISRGAVLTGTVLVVDYHATWCGPCKMLAPHYAALASQLGGPRCMFLKVDGDVCQGLVQGAGVNAYPTVHVYWPPTGTKLGEVKGADAGTLGRVVRESMRKGRTAREKALRRARAAGGMEALALSKEDEMSARYVGPCVADAGLLQAVKGAMEAGVTLGWVA